MYGLDWIRQVLLLVEVHLKCYVPDGFASDRDGFGYAQVLTPSGLLFIHNRGPGEERGKSSGEEKLHISIVLDQQETNLRCIYLS